MCSRPVPKGPGLPPQPPRALHAAGARGKHGLSQLDEAICIKLIKKKQTPKPQTKSKPQPCASPGGAALALPGGVSGTLWHSSGRAGQRGKVSAVASIAISLGGAVPVGTVPSATGTSCSVPFLSSFSRFPFTPPQPGGLQNNGVRQQSLAAAFPFPWSVAQSLPDLRLPCAFIKCKDVWSPSSSSQSTKSSRLHYLTSRMEGLVSMMATMILSM